MNFIAKIKNLPPKMKIMVITGGVLVSVLVLFMVFNVTGKEDPITYEYDSAIERRLADEVKAYLGEYLILEEHDSNIIANEAVLGYRTIMESGIQSVTDEHADALNQNMRRALDEYTSDDQITYDDLEALASGISKIILDTILQQLEQSTMANMESYKEEYRALAESLQMQIDALNKKSTSVNITAHIRDSRNDIADAKSEIYDNVEREINSIRQTVSSISDGEDGKDGADGKDGRDGIDGKNGTNGKDGKNGTDGKNGANGKDGVDGKDGTNGKTTYLAYADDNTGKGFSLTPTPTSKYIGTCVTAETTQPARASAYTNWQLIAGENGKDGLDGINGQDGADGKTTYFAYADDNTGKGFSLTPTPTSKYIGTCVTAETTQPAKASLYTNWQLIAGENGKDGQDGADGKTTYIAYANDQYGNGFSINPTERSKYIGTCITAESTQPTKASAYYWQLYRSYIITSATDENSNTTLYIK